MPNKPSERSVMTPELFAHQIRIEHWPTKQTHDDHFIKLYRECYSRLQAAENALEQANERYLNHLQKYGFVDLSKELAAAENIIQHTRNLIDCFWGKDCKKEHIKTITELIAQYDKQKEEV